MKKLVIFAFALLLCLSAGAQKSNTKKTTTTQQTTTAAQTAPAPKAAAQPAASTQPKSTMSVVSSSRQQFVPKKGDFSFGVA